MLKRCWLWLVGGRMETGKKAHGRHFMMRLRTGEKIMAEDRAIYILVRETPKTAP
jgi:hypothetical protein